MSRPVVDPAFFEYYDEGDKCWKRIRNMHLADVPFTTMEWFAQCKLKVRTCEVQV